MRYCCSSQMQSVQTMMVLTMFLRLLDWGYTNIDITIYNRWGEQIYKSDDFKQWDGTYKGEKVQMGAYVYIMNIVDNRGRKYHESGEIQVVR